MKSTWCARSLGGAFSLTEKSSISGSGTMVSWGEVLQLTSKVFWKQLYSKFKNKWEMYALKRCKTKVSTPCRLLLRSFRDFHNINLCFVYCLFKQINSMMCNKGFLKAKKREKEETDLHTISFRIYDK